jgi:hypothetical protein
MVSLSSNPLATANRRTSAGNRVRDRDLSFNRDFDAVVIDPKIVWPVIHAANSVQPAFHFPLPASFDAVRLRCGARRRAAAALLPDGW